MKTRWKHAKDIPPRARGLFFARARKNDKPCEYGHFGCSDREGGPCSEELWHMTKAGRAEAEAEGGVY